MRKPLFLGIVAVVVIAGVIGTIIATNSDSENQVTVTRFTVTLSGDQEAPPVTSPATGEAVFMLSADGESMSFTLNVANLTGVTASHIHLAQPGVSGPVVVPLFAGTKPGTFSGVLAQGTFTAADFKGLLLGKPMSALITEIGSNNAYVNVHTTAHPPGEIRGLIRQVAP